MLCVSIAPKALALNKERNKGDYIDPINELKGETMSEYFNEGQRQLQETFETVPLAIFAASIPDGKSAAAIVSVPNSSPSSALFTLTNFPDCPV